MKPVQYVKKGYGIFRSTAENDIGITSTTVLRSTSY